MTAANTKTSNVIRHKTPLRVRAQTPAAQQLLSPNDDDFERAQARAALAAASRRKSNIAVHLPPPPGVESEKLLGKDQILELFQNCVKLASENKINQRNTWELKLIDHLSEIINVDVDDTETNFQKASCTLEAGVKIYSYRVDSVHAEAYKVLGGLNRTSVQGNEVDGHREEGQLKRTEEDEGETRKEHQKKISASLATLESSFDALNVKKFDVAFTVDPLYHQTSAQFDEGGAKGLLLNTLSVFDDCRIIFDSWEVPEKSMKLVQETNTDSLSIIDLSFVKDFIERSVSAIQATEISPTLEGILKLLDDPYRAAAQTASARQNEDMLFDSSHVNEENVDEASTQYFEINYAPDISLDDGLACASPESTCWDSTVPEGHDREESLCDGSVEYAVNEESSLSEQTVDFLVLGMGMASKSNAWAGPEHWKFHKSKVTKQSSEAPGDTLGEKKSRKTRREPFLVDFMNIQEIDIAAFAPPKNQRSLQLAQNNSCLGTVLPEDCHYQPEELVKLFTLASVMCIRKRGSKETDDSTKKNENNRTPFTWVNGDYQDGCAANWDDVHDESDFEDLNDNNMVAQPRKVSKIDVDYDKTSKEVDVRILKKTLWTCIQESAKAMEEDYECRLESTIPLTKLLNDFPVTCKAAAPENISVHLCFICLLHLANERNLKIQSCPSLEELFISNIPMTDNFSDECD